MQVARTSRLTTCSSFLKLLNAQITLYRNEKTQESFWCKVFLPRTDMALSARGDLPCAGQAVENSMIFKTKSFIQGSLRLDFETLSYSTQQVSFPP